MNQSQQKSIKIVPGSVGIHVEKRVAYALIAKILLTVRALVLAVKWTARGLTLVRVQEYLNDPVT